MSITISSSMTSKGQVTVPQKIRRRLGLSAGDRVEFVIEGDKTLIRPARARDNVFEKYKGALGSFPGGRKEINEWLRDLRDEEDTKR
ncbi:MAG TPA: AbrB/MazE/SpoVT family DNA-binding domain-containing protein [Terriglobales bacterium]